MKQGVKLTNKEVEVGMRKFFNHCRQYNRMPLMSSFAIRMNMSRASMYRWFDGGTTKEEKAERKYLKDMFDTYNEELIFSLNIKGKLSDRMTERYLSNKHKTHYKSDASLTYREKQLAEVEKLNAMKEHDTEQVETNKTIINFTDNSKINFGSLLEDID